MEVLKQACDLARRELERSRATPADRGVLSATRRSDAPIRYTQTRIISTKAGSPIIGDAAGDVMAEAFALLRTRLMHRMEANGWNALAVTSPSPGEGKTLTAINLAISFARATTHTVLLADLDLRRPQAHRYFGYRPERGVCDHLLHEVPLSEILFNPQVDGLVVLPGGEPMSNSSEMLSSPRMARLVHELKNRYPSRIVLFDMPPMLSSDDVLAFAPHPDAFLLVVEDGRTRRDDLARSFELLSETRVAGTVLNRCRESLDRPG